MNKKTGLRSKKKRKIWWMVGVSLSIVLFVAYALGTFSSIALNRELAEARAAGFPVEPEDVFTDPPPEDAENAALLFELMAVEEERTILLVQPLGREAFIDYISGRAQYDVDRVVSYLGKHDALLTLAEQASALPSYRADIDWSNPVYGNVTDFSAVKLAVRLLIGRAMIAQDNADHESALADLERILQLSNRVRQSGTMLGQWAALSLGQNYFRSVQLIVAHDSVDNDFVRKLLVQLEKWPDRPDLSQCFRIGAYAGVWSPTHIEEIDSIFPRWDWGDGLPKTDKDWEAFAWTLPTIQAEATQIALEYWQNVLATYDKDSDDLVAWAARIDTLRPKGSGYSGGAESLAGVRIYPLHSFIESVVENNSRKAVIVSSLREILRESGETADVLETDQWTGNALVHKLTPTGFTIYSVGSDGIDDGGQAYRNSTSDRMDIVFEYPKLRESPAVPSSISPPTTSTSPPGFGGPSGY